jgi:uncharacterized protein
MLNRFNTVKLDTWFKSSTRKPLILRGARQVGKSTLVDLFAKTHHVTLAAVNLERQMQLEPAFKSLDPQLILQDIASIKSAQFSARTQLLFLDEIQAIPVALQSLRYFYEDIPNLAVVCAGSLLEFAMGTKQFSMPVGRVEHLRMHPMSYFEFLDALQEFELLNILRQYKIGDKIGPAVHTRLQELQKLYFLVGGLPEAVNIYAQTRKLENVSKVHKSILESYFDDIPKYGGQRDLMRMRKVLQYCGTHFSQRIKYSNIDNSEQANTLKKDIELMCMAGLITKVTHSHCNGVPLGAELGESKFKLLFLDIGLANSMMGLKLTDLEAHTDVLNVANGALAEQFVGQHILEKCENSFLNPLVFWTRDGKSGNAEIDFVVSHGNEIVPIEVKSGKSGSMRSLHQFCYEKNFKRAFRFDSNPPSVQKVNAEANDAGTFKPVSYDLFSFPLYLVERALELLKD